MSMAWEPDRRSNFFSTPAHLSAITYITKTGVKQPVQSWSHLKTSYNPTLAHNTTVTLPKPMVTRRSVSQKWENRATSADCRPTSASILAIFLVGRRLFCRSTQVKSFVDRSADFHGFCHRWSVGRWSPDDRPTFWKFFHRDIGRRSPDHRASVGRRSPDGRSMTFYQRSVGRQTPDIGRHSADDRPTVGRSLTLNCIILFTMHVSILIMKYITHLFYFGIHFIWPRVHLISGFCVGFPTELFVWHLHLKDCNLILDILLYIIIAT